jgi:hypothetical protein
MAHLSTVEVEDAVAVALEYRIPTVVDNLYLSTPVFKILDMEERITADGGTRIEQPFIYDRPPGGSYRGMDTLDITRRKTKALLTFEWKQYFAAVTVDGLTRLKTSGERAVVDLVDVELQGAELALKQDLGVDTYLDGTGNNGKALDGFDIAIATTGTYGGINRATDAEGTAIRGQVDSTGGPFSLQALQSAWGSATFGPEHPTLIATTQAIFDAAWARLQPQQRFPQGAVAEELARAGFNVIMFNGVPMTVDQAVAAGTIYGLNTKFVKLIAHAQRADLEVEGPLTPTQADARTWRLFWAGNFVTQAPRMQFRMTGIT